MTTPDPLGEFGLTIRFVLGRPVLRVVGDIDLLSAPTFAAVLDAVIDQGNAAVVLDFAEVGFMGAEGLGIIASRVGRLAGLGGGFTIRSPSLRLARLLDIVSLTALVQMEHSEAPARLGPAQIERAAAVVRLDGTNLARHLRRVTSIPADNDVVDGALRLVVALARATVGGADGVSVSLRRHGRLATVAASDQTILDMDAGQYATGEGPCVDASVEGRWFHVASLDDETRWPSFVPRAKQLGINAILSSPLLTDEHPVGAINIYSRTIAAFAPKDQELASIFADEASIILRDAGVAVSDNQLSQRLQEALANRELIAIARGIIMERDGISSDEAFGVLRRFSQDTSTPLRQRAADVVSSARLLRHGPSDHDHSDRE